MKKTITKAKSLRGELSVPADKSITHRAVMIGSIAEGLTETLNFSEAGDPKSTLSCIEALGVETKLSKSPDSANAYQLQIRGKGLRGLSKSNSPLDAGNSGTTIRLLTGILAAQQFDSTITGDKSLCRRPMDRIIEPLSKMGAKIHGTALQTPPLTIQSVKKLHPIDYELPLPSAQVKSSILLAGLYAEGKTRVVESISTRDHTERMLGLNILHENGKKIIEVEGGKAIEPKRFIIPGDISAAAFFIVAALFVPNSELYLKNIGLNPTRTAVLDILEGMGAHIEISHTREICGELMGDLTVKSSELRNVPLKGEIIPKIIDEIPIIAVAGTQAKGVFELRDAGDLRNKESDRIASIAFNLRALGVEVQEYKDGFTFEGERNLRCKGPLEGFDDHRITMAFGIAGLITEGATEILNAESVSTSFPNFWETLAKIKN